MTPPDWARQRVAKTTTGYNWNGRIRKSQVDLRAIAARLLRLEHARGMKVVKKFQKTVSGLSDCEAKRFAELILRDLLTALQRGRTNKKGRK